MAALAQGFTLLLAKIAAVLTWFGKLFVACFVAVWDLARDAACWVFEEVMSIAVSAVGAVQVGSVVSQAQAAFGALPGDIVAIMATLGFGTAMAIVTGAIAVRIVLQLIPFTRLGS